jgi:hypothetical protein
LEKDNLILYERQGRHDEAIGQKQATQFHIWENLNIILSLASLTRKIPKLAACPWLPYFIEYNTHTSMLRTLIS